VDSQKRTQRVARPRRGKRAESRHGAKGILAFPRHFATHRREHGAVETLARLEIRDAYVHVIEEPALVELH
jgi:hypothetical protein